LFLKKFMSLLIALLIIGILSFQIYKISTTDISDFDNALLATAAKNFAFGHDYATSFHTVKKFDPGISTGPTIIMPVALFIKVFGNKYWAPSLAGSLIIIILLLIVLWLPSKLGLSSIKHQCYCLLVLLFIVCYVSRGWEYLWASLCGDVPSALFAIIATMLLFSSNTPSVWRSLIAGLVAGAAFLTKTMAAFNMIVLLMLLPVWLFLIHKDRLSWKKAQLYMVIFVVGMAILPVSFEAYKKASLSVQDYKVLRVEARKFFYEAGSGIAQIQAATSRLDYIKNNIQEHNRAFADYTGGTFSCFILLIIILLAFAGSLGKSSLHFISYVLLLSSLAQFIWWECIANQAWIRYLYLALIFLIVAISILITQVKKPALRIAIICLCVIFFIPTLDSFKTRFPERHYNKERFASLLKAVDFMKVNNNYRYLGAGQWASWELEYLLPGVNNFKKLTAQEEKEMKNIALIRDTSYREPLGRRIYLTKLAVSSEKILFYSPPVTISLVVDPDGYREAGACECANENNCPGIKNPKCEWMETACNFTDGGTWVNGVAKSWAAAFFVFNTFHARNELTVGKKITFADGTTRTIVRTKENEGDLIVFLDGAPLVGTIVGYPQKFTVHHGKM
jgi:hypothetical protein